MNETYELITMGTTANLLIIEPFYGGSHKQLIDTLINGLNLQESCLLVTLPAKKWHWRARTSALRISQLIPVEHNFRVLFASSVLNLAELVALRPDLLNLQKVVYFHENQLVYPVRKCQDRDFQYGYNQILTCLVADTVVFNSEFNKQSFLDTMAKFLKLQPDCRPVGLPEQIATKCSVLYFPINLPVSISSQRQGPLHIIWPHRWEHDKDPETFMSTLMELLSLGLDFRVSLLGQSSIDIPPKVADAKEKLGGKVSFWGYHESREDYLQALRTADVVVSTAIHEFFGVAMLEAVACGCFPLCPNKLVYPEFYPERCLYKSPQHLTEVLSLYCQQPHLPRQFSKELNIDLERFSTKRLFPAYSALLSVEYSDLK